MNQHQEIINNGIAAQTQQQLQADAFSKGNTIEQLVIKNTDFNPDGSVKQKPKKEK